jgi:hypothetical protein
MRGPFPDNLFIKLLLVHPSIVRQSLFIEAKDIEEESVGNISFRLQDGTFLVIPFRSSSLPPLNLGRHFL